jgi:hypothetical protein
LIDVMEVVMIELVVGVFWSGIDVNERREYR